jgi:hypothetical protein
MIKTDDIRIIPAAIGTNLKRHSIVPAKSIPANNMGVTTGEIIYQVRF